MGYIENGRERELRMLLLTCDLCCKWGEWGKESQVAVNVFETLCESGSEKSCLAMQRVDRLGPKLLLFYLEVHFGETIV